MKNKGFYSDEEDQDTNTVGLPPNPEDFEKALASVAEFVNSQSKLYELISSLSRLLPAKKVVKEVRYSGEQYKAMFLNGHPNSDIYNNVVSLIPSSIALVALDDFFKNSARFEKIDPTTLPYHNKRLLPFEPIKVMHTTIELANEPFNVPTSGEIWLKDLNDKDFNHVFVVHYAPSPGGSIDFMIESSNPNRHAAVSLAQEVKKHVLTSKFLRGQIIEINGGSNFKIVDIGDQGLPIISADLMSELQKNVINLFDKGDEFKGYGLPIKRSIILEGPPGCGKTMIARYLASSLKGRVTTIWVTAKSVTDTDDVANVFDIARKLSPSLIIMEDLDLISGTRDQYMGGENCLGEMLNQLDGLTANDSIVLVGSTNAVASLDDALKDRPGRFDRIYEIGHPDAELAEVIARNYLLKCGVSEDQVQKLTLASILTSSYSGAQIIEIVKGGIFEAIHRGVEVDDRCIKASRDGLDKQKSRIQAMSK